MQIDRHVELFGASEDRPEFLAVDEFAIRHAVDHGALEAELGDAAFEFVGGGGGIDGGEGGEGGEPLRIGGAHRRQAVIDLCGQGGGDFNRQLLGRRRAMRQHLDVDSSLIHFLDPQGAEIEQPLLNGSFTAGLRAGEMLGELGVPIVLFDGDDRTIRLFEHFASPRSLMPAWRPLFVAPVLATGPGAVTSPARFHPRDSWCVWCARRCASNV